jgi:hypothetical protein
MQAIAGLFGGKKDDGGAAALAKKQQEDIDKRRAEEQTKKDSQLALLRGLQGRGGTATMFETGTEGVRAETLG